MVYFWIHRNIIRKMFPWASKQFFGAGKFGGMLWVVPMVFRGKVPKSFWYLDTFMPFQVSFVLFFQYFLVNNMHAYQVIFVLSKWHCICGILIFILPVKHNLLTLTLVVPRVWFNKSKFIFRISNWSFHQLYFNKKHVFYKS